jgi:hypothetical protein
MALAGALGWTKGAVGGSTGEGIAALSLDVSISSRSSIFTFVLAQTGL